MARIACCTRAHELRQHVVAGGVARLIVDALEVIDVAHDDGQRLRIAAAAFDLARQLLLQVAAIVGAGQCIGDGEIAVALIRGTQGMLQREDAPSRIQARDEFGLVQRLDR